MLPFAPSAALSLLPPPLPLLFPASLSLLSRALALRTSALLSGGWDRGWGIRPFGGWRRCLLLRTLFILWLLGWAILAAVVAGG